MSESLKERSRKQIFILFKYKMNYTYLRCYKIFFVGFGLQFSNRDLLFHILS